ncbi:UDP-glucuronosyltransferase [Cenarchaeum symbiosum A]|uniref:UDP-glucuronosyltransferase n=1 Tax=Cenarchaeum symbiosum (strain A) TaxID=414004 RepID=A0RXC6_CENSY|nr:UDP-glucuronosyltransferase [Cenarchaeum symbiosum A]
MGGILFFCSPIGLGHATRDAAIAGCLEGPVRFVSGGAAARLLSGKGHDTDDILHPPEFAVRDGMLHSSLRWLLGYYRYYKECRKEALGAIQMYKPDLIVSDEDFASLSAAQELGIRSVLITDILETQFTSSVGRLIEGRMNRAMRGMIDKCDTVIMPEDGEDRGNIRRVGPIVRAVSGTRDEMRSKYGLTRETILVSIGGTAAGRFLMEEVARIAPGLADKYDIVAVPGPSLDWEAPGIRNLGYVEDLHELVCAADVVVSLAGKSTIDEARAFGTPGIFIPIGGHFEQVENAKDEGYSRGDLANLEALIRGAGPRGKPVPGGGTAEACSIIADTLANA